MPRRRPSSASCGRSSSLPSVRVVGLQPGSDHSCTRPMPVTCVVQNCEMHRIAPRQRGDHHKLGRSSECSRPIPRRLHLCATLSSIIACINTVLVELDDVYCMPKVIDLCRHDHPAVTRDGLQLRQRAGAQAVPRLFNIKLPTSRLQVHDCLQIFLQRILFDGVEQDTARADCTALLTWYRGLIVRAIGLDCCADYYAVLIISQTRISRRDLV